MRPVGSSPLLLVAMTVACGDGRPATVDDFGTIIGTDARIALVRDETALVVYVCGGPNTLGALTTWFVGAADVTHLENGAATLDLSRTSTGSSGTVRAMDGRTFTFSAARVGADVDAGLFEVVDRGCRAGFIFDPVLGAQGVWCDGEGRFAQVDPGAPFGPQAIEARVQRPDGPASLTFERVSPAERFIR